MLLAAREFRVAVVLTHEEHGKLPQHRKIEGFVEDTRTRGAVPKKNHAQALLASRLGSPRRSGCQRQIAAHDAGRTQHSVSGVNKVHGAAPAPAQAGLAANYFGEGSLHVSALGEHMTVASMAREKN